MFRTQGGKHHAQYGNLLRTFGDDCLSRSLYQTFIVSLDNQSFCLRKTRHCHVSILKPAKTLVLVARSIHVWCVIYLSYFLKTLACFLLLLLYKEVHQVFGLLGYPS